MTVRCLSKKAAGRGSRRFGGRQGQVARGWPSMSVRLGFSLGFEGLGFGVWPFKVS